MKYSTIAILTLSILTAILMHQQTQSMKYRLGLGKIDMTSSIGEINMMGYADPIQQANGILLRLYARSFIIGYLNTRLALVIVDAGMVSATIKQDAINMLNNRLLEEHDDYTYSIDNVMISATHTHSGPGGYMDDFLYHITSLGQVPVIKDAITFAIYESLYMAHLNFIVSEEINIYFGVGNCLNASINRSPKAYQQNPESERLLYNDDVDREMTVLSFRNTHDNRLLGAISWFAVHATSMSKENQLVSGDNKGVASYLWEKYEREQGNSNFVAAFPQSNSGDISPNILGSRCINSGEFCDGAEDDCDGDITKCRSRGPDEDDILSTMIIGTRQYNAAKRILESSKKLTTSNLEFRHVFVNMSDVPLVHEGKIIKTCLPAMGASFAAGTTDGPGHQSARQNISSNTPLLNLVRDAIVPPSKSQTKCHFPKQIFLSTGEMSYPYRWQPTILPLQILIISTNAIIAVPAELTTMAGRRLKNAISTQLKEDNTIPSTGHVILSSLSNSYSSYITTFEEYQIQRYEGGSTIYGPHTLMAYIDQFTRLATTFKDGFLKSADGHEGVSNPISLLPPILMDLPILNLPVTWFGTVLKQPEDCFIKSTVVVGFVCGHPRTNSNQRFCSVEKRFDNRWIEFLSDGGLDVGYKWKRIGVMSGYCECDWRVGFTYLVGGGEYRMRYTGKHKMLGYIGAEVGVSKSFKVLDFSSNDDM